MYIIIYCQIIGLIGADDASLLFFYPKTLKYTVMVQVAV